MATSINTILGWFKTGNKPTQRQFWDSWQSFWHKDEAIPQSSINNLVSTLDTKADKSTLKELTDSLTTPISSTLQDVLKSGNTYKNTFYDITCEAEISDYKFNHTTYNSSWTRYNIFRKTLNEYFTSIKINSEANPRYYTENLDQRDGQGIQLISTEGSDNGETMASLILTRFGVGISTLAYRANLRTENLTVAQTFQFPNQSGTLALLSDIKTTPLTLQDVLNNGSTIQNPNIVLTNSFDGATGNLFNGQFRFFSDGNDRSGIYGTGQMSLKFGDYKNDSSPEGFFLYKYSTNKVSQYLYPNPDGFTKIFPVSIDGNYANTDGVISTVTQNNTTTALSNSYLNTTYSNAGIGFRVQCLNITEGALTYEKTPTNWIQYAINVVMT
jgi:hypothetical protein